MDKHKGEICGCCRFWVCQPDEEHIEETAYVGSCRRYAPRVEQYWPLTEILDWCGDFEVKT